MERCDFCGEVAELLEMADGYGCRRCFDGSSSTCIICSLPLGEESDTADPATDQPLCHPCWNNAKPRPLVENAVGRSVGYEFEFLFRRSELSLDLIQELRNYGSMRYDGSLRGNNHHPVAIELATHYGSAEPLWAMLHSLCDIFAQQWFAHNDSCGLHLHLGMNGSTELERKRLYRWWRLLEPAIVLLVEPARLTNAYCRSARRVNYNEDRYAALNTSCYRSSHAARTFEVRLHHMTFDEQIIRGWTQFLLSFFDTFTVVRLTIALRQNIAQMTVREKLIFMMQQTKAPLSLWKYAVKTMRTNYSQRDLDLMLRTPDYYQEAA